MLGTQASYANQYSTPASTVKARHWRNSIIAGALLLLLAAGGWWAYQNVFTTQQAGAVAAVAAPTQSTAAQAPAAQAPAAATQPTTAAAAADAAPAAGLTQAALAGVAGVDGAQVWSDDGTLLATLDSGAILSIQARTDGDAWLAVQTDAGTGWAQAAAVVAYGLHNLATAELPAAVVAAATPFAAVTAPAETAAAAEAADLSLADLVAAPASSTAAQPSAAQLTATIAATASRLNIRSGPGTDYTVIAKAAAGAVYQAVGRTLAGDWLLLQLSADPNDTGWASAAYIQLSGDVQTLPAA